MTATVILAFLRRVPWQLWALLLASAVLLGTYWLGKSHANAACQARWEAVQEAVQDEIDRREKAAFDAGAKAAQDAAQARQDTRKETDEAVERVRVEWREKVVRVPAECRAAVDLPDSVRDEGRKAVARANGELRR